MESSTAVVINSAENGVRTPTPYSVGHRNRKALILFPPSAGELLRTSGNDLWLSASAVRWSVGIDRWADAVGPLIGTDAKHVIDIRATRLEICGAW